VPFHQNPHFTGRDELMAGLHGALAVGKPGVLVQALHGMGGVGKTRMAVEYAYAHAAEYDVVWFLRADNSTTLLADYAALGVAVGAVLADAANQTEAAKLVRRWLDSNDRSLLIFDDAPEPSVVREYLPQHSGGHVIVTSRSPGWRGLGAALKVEVLDKSRAADFLLERTGQADLASAESLATELDGLPLALEQAAAFMEGSGTPLSDYLAMYRSRRFDLLGRASGPDDHQSNVAATYSLAIDRLLADTNPTVRASVDLLRLCAFLAPQPDSIPLFLLRHSDELLPEPLASLVADELKLSLAIATLRQQALIDRTDAGLSVHRLVDTVIQGALNPSARERWQELALEIVATAAIAIEPQDFRQWPSWVQLGPHVDALTVTFDEAHVDGRLVASILGSYGIYLTARAQFGEARVRQERALRITEAVYGLEHQQVAIRLSNLAVVLDDLGDLEGARDQLERAIRIKESIYGSEHPEVARPLGNLGNVLRELGDLDGARERLERALQIFEIAYGPNHPEVARALTNLGSVLDDLGDFEGARAILERALRIKEAAFGTEHPDVAITLANLGRVLWALEDLGRAREMMDRALTIFVAKLGPDHPTTQTVRQNLEDLTQVDSGTDEE
jgi:tetratricopeptide (TPR) repeat protein